MSQGIYSFLCALQAQGTAGDLGWDWGPLRDAPFLPRVVVRPAGAVPGELAGEPGRAEAARPGAGAARFRAVQRWRAARRLPRWIALADGDNELPIDLDNVLAVDTLVELVKGREQATLVELFPGPDQLCVRGPEGRFVHELVVPFVRRGERRRRAGTRGRRAERIAVAAPRHRTSASLASRPAPSGCTPSSTPARRPLDQVLRDVVRPVVETAVPSRRGGPLVLRPLRRPRLAPAAAVPRPAGPAAAARCSPPCKRPRRPCWTTAGCGGSSSTPTSARSSATAAPRASSWPSGSSTPTARPSWRWPGCFPEDARGDVRWRLALRRDGPAPGRPGLRPGHAACGHPHRRGTRSRPSSTRMPSFEHQLGAKFRPERKGLEALLDPTPEADTPLASGLEVLRRRSRTAGARDGRAEGLRAGRPAVRAAAGAGRQLPAHARQPPAPLGPPGAGAGPVRLPGPSLSVPRQSAGATT